MLDVTRKCSHTGSNPVLTTKINNMENKERNLITIDLSGCKNWNECEKVIGMITSGKIKIKTNNIKLWKTKN